MSLTGADSIPDVTVRESAWPPILVGLLLWLFSSSVVAAQSADLELTFAAGQLTEGGSAGVVVDGEELKLAAHAPAPSIFQPHPRFGVAMSGVVELPGVFRIRDLLFARTLPDGSELLLEIRGEVDGGWTEWRGVEALRALDGAAALQLRALLLAAPDGGSPTLRSATVRAEQLAPDSVPVSASAFGPPTATLWATREGLVGGTTANGHVIVERDRFVALPSTRPLNGRGQYDYVVRVAYQGRVAQAPVWDVGPWNIHDDYWNEARERFADLQRWTPEAEAAYFSDYNGGRDEFGRFVTIPTSIDLADGTFWDDLGMTGNDWVQVTFLWLDAPSPPVRSTPVIVPKAPPPPAFVAATPNPVPGGSGLGTTVIEWSTGSGSGGQVWVSLDGQPEGLFGQGASGSQQAVWIQSGVTYTFKLYAGTARITELARVTVTRPFLATLTGAPNPVPAGVGLGTTTIAWDTGDGSVGQVYAQASPGSETLFGEGPGGSQPASWIGDSSYTFRLYAGRSRGQLLQSLTVTRLVATLSAAPNPPSPGAGLASTTIQWATGDGTHGQVYVSRDGGAESLFAAGAAGSQTAPWIEGGSSYAFRLYAGTARDRLLRMLSVARLGPTLSATPNPVPADSSSTAIQWDTFDGATGQVYVSANGGAEVLFSQGNRGAQTAAWIQLGNTYIFRLYAGTIRANLLKSLSVIRPS